MGPTGDDADLRVPHAAQLVAPISAPLAAPISGPIDAPLVVPPAGGAGHAVARGDAVDTSHGTGDLSRNPLLPLRRLGAGAALDQGVDLLRFRFRRLVGLAACVVLPVQLVDLLLRLTVTSGPAEDVDLGGAGVLAVGTSDWAAVTVVLQALGLSILGICVGHLVARLVEGGDASFRELLSVGLRRSWVALALLPMTVLVRGLLIWIPVVGFVLGDALVFVASVVAGAERVGPLAALGRNLRLFRAQSGAAIALALGSLAITMVLRLSLYAGPQALVYALGPPEGVMIAVQQLAALVQLVIEPLTACLAATSYLLLSCRVDGLDLELRRRGRLAEAARAGGAATDLGPAPAGEVLADVAR